MLYDLRRSVSSLGTLAKLTISLFTTVIVLLGTALISNKNDERGLHQGLRNTPIQMSQESESLRQFTTRDPAGFFSFCLAAIGVVQAALFVWQLRLLRESVADGEKAANAATEAANAAKDSTTIARLALESAETPYLVPVVRAFDKTVDPLPPSPSIEGLVSLAFENCGRSPATVLEVYHSTFASSSTPNPIGFPPLQTNLRKTYILAPGRVSDPWHFTVGHFVGWSPSDQTRVAWILGTVRFSDVFGNQFITGFCFYRNAFHNGWGAQGGPQHNFRRKLSAEEMMVAHGRDGLISAG